MAAAQAAAAAVALSQLADSRVTTAVPLAPNGSTAPMASPAASRLVHLEAFRSSSDVAQNGASFEAGSHSSDGARLSKVGVLEARIEELRRELGRTTQELASRDRTIADSYSEMTDLRASLARRDSEIQRLKAQASCGGVVPSETQGPQVNAERVAQLEAENERLREQLKGNGREPLDLPVDVVDTEREATGAAGGDAAARGGDRWKQALADAEAGITRALEMAVSQPDMLRVPRQTRLQLLSNSLKQGVLKVNQAMMTQTLQDLKKSASGGSLPAVPFPVNKPVNDVGSVPGEDAGR